MRLLVLVAALGCGAFAWTGTAAAKTQHVTLKGTVLVKHADVFRKNLAEYWYTLRTKKGPVKLVFFGQGPSYLGGARVVVHGTRARGAVHVPYDGVRLLASRSKTAARSIAVGPQRL